MLAFISLRLPLFAQGVLPLGYSASSPPTIRVGDVATTACQGTVEVPIFASNHDIADGVEIAVDYDAAVLGYAWQGVPNPDWRIDRSMQYGQGRVIFSMRRAPDTKPANPQPKTPEAKLLNVVFYLKSVCRADAPFQVVGPVGLGGTDAEGNATDSFFVAQGAGQAVRPIPTHLEPGRVTVYTKDGLEVGWGALTRGAAQTFTLPLYLTITDPTERLFLVGVDYDELFLNMSGVRGCGPTNAQRTDGKLVVQEEGKKLFEVELLPAFSEEICRLHVADLLFQYKGATPLDSELRVQARLLRKVEQAVGAPAEVAGAGGVYGEAVPGVLQVLPPHFVRGNVDSSSSVGPSGEVRYTPDILDAQRVLHSLFLGTVEVPCLDAADVNDNSKIEVSDAIALLNYFYRSGPPPAAPFPSPGADPEREGSSGDRSLGCRRAIPVFTPVPTP